MTLEIHNFGCRLNALDGDYIRLAAEAAGQNKATIINSCAVTAHAVKTARQAVRKAAKKHPDHAIYVTGCATQIDKTPFSHMPEVTAILGNEEKLTPQAYATQYVAPQYVASQTNKAVNDIMQLKQALPRPPPLQQQRVRALVQIQTGCNHRCTFCVIPYGRGNSRSTPIKDVIRDCRLLVEQGHKEIILTGVDITSWGPDIGQEGLGVLVCEILKKIPHLKRLRLSSVDAVELDAKLLDRVIEDTRIMPHLHLSLQSGDDMILKRMKRRHSRQEAITFCQTIRQRRPEIVFGADMIAGFPTETEDMFENSRRLIEECNLIWLHVFPYSSRPYTPAAKMPQIPQHIIHQRAKLLRQTGENVRKKWLDAQIGRKVSVLMEKPHLGRTETFAHIYCTSEDPPHTIITAHVTGHDGKSLKGKII